MNDVHYSSEKDDWCTPKWLFDLLNERYKFTTDLFASPENALLPNYLTDCFNQTYTGFGFGNPPYRRSKPTTWDFVKWAYEQGNPCALLLPARTDTAGWHRCCMSSGLHFIKGRLNFNGGENSAPFPSVVVLLNTKLRGILECIDAGKRTWI